MENSWGAVTLSDTQLMKWQHWLQALCELFALKPTPLKPTLFKMPFHLKIQDNYS